MDVSKSSMWMNKEIQKKLWLGLNLNVFITEVKERALVSLQEAM